VREVSKVGLSDMKALLPPVPVLATESQEQFEKIFDQVVTALRVEDMVELILVRDFVLPSWEIARYTRHRAVAFDRKFKNIVVEQFSHLRDQKERREARAKRLAEYIGQRPADVSHLEKLDDTVMESREDINQILKRTPGELTYNRALENSIGFHKDLELLIASMTKRRDQALEMLNHYRRGLGRRAEQATKEILDAEYNVVENQPTQIALPLAPTVEPKSESQEKADHSVTTDSN
jgi:hypothetical protein